MNKLKEVRQMIGAAKYHLDKAAAGEYAEGNILNACAQLTEAISVLAGAIQKTENDIRTINAYLAKEFK